MTSAVDSILHLFELHGESEYGGEEVTQLEHALQAATLAEAAGSSPSLITAALLHNIGHLMHSLPNDSPDSGIDDLHETSGHRFLQQYLPDSVTEPVRLHVAAKRYLCAVDPSYAAQLSPPSVTSLQLQGGPMSADEIRDFEDNHWSQDAVRLRKWDDQAKIAGLAVPTLDHFSHALQQVVSKESS